MRELHLLAEVLHLARQHHPGTGLQRASNRARVEEGGFDALMAVIDHHFEELTVFAPHRDHLRRGDGADNRRPFTGFETLPLVEVPLTHISPRRIAQQLTDGGDIQRGKACRRLLVEKDTW